MNLQQPIKVIFLDIDGVVCFGDDIIDQEKIKLLNILIKNTGAFVVISSALRKFYKRIELCDLFNQAGFEGTIIGVTPILDSQRGLEVKEWLKKTRYQILSFVIFDDNSDFDEFGMNRLVQTSFSTGLQPLHIVMAEKILNKKLE